MTAPTVASTPPPSGLAPVVDVRELTKVFGSGETEVHALRGIDLQIARGDYVAVDPDEHPRLSRHLDVGFLPA